MISTGTPLPMAAAHNSPHAARSGCRCGETETVDPVLDARTIPHALRHGAVLGALESLPAGAALVLVAPHDPQPLLAQARERIAEGVEVTYLQREPGDWRLRVRRA